MKYLFATLAITLLSTSFAFAQRPNQNQIQQEVGEVTAIDTVKNTITISASEFRGRGRSSVFAITPTTVYVNEDTGVAGIDPKAFTDVLTTNKKVESTLFTMTKRDGATLTRVAIIVMYNPPPAPAPAPAPTTP